MSQPEKEDILYTVLKLAPYLDEETQARVKVLLRRIETEASGPFELLDLLVSAGEFARAWIRSALLGEMDEAGTRLLLSGSSLPGNPHSIPAGSIWICPSEGCDFAWHVRHAGQPVPPCPNHKLTLVPKP